MLSTCWGVVFAGVSTVFVLNGTDSTCRGAPLCHLWLGAFPGEFDFYEGRFMLNVGFYSAFVWPVLWASARIHFPVWAATLVVPAGLIAHWVFVPATAQVLYDITSLRGSSPEFRILFIRALPICDFVNTVITLLAAAYAGVGYFHWLRGYKLKVSSFLA